MFIDYLQIGERGKTLVFLHGWQQNKGSFASFLPYLDKNYKKVLIDLPGFGKTPQPKEVFSSYDYAHEISSWLKLKKFKKITLLGHSFGGKIAAILAAENPKMVENLILIASSGLPKPQKKINLFINKFVPPFLKKNLGPHFIKLFTSDDYQNAGEMLPIFKKVVKEDISSDFAKIITPTLIIWGKNDEAVPLRFGQKIHHLIRDSHFRIFEGGHFVFWERPKEVAYSINDFLKNKC